MKKDLVGEKFGRLTVLRPVSKDSLPPTKSRSKVYECLCDCGNTIYTRASLLRAGDKKSCGCLQKEVFSLKAIEKFTTHNLSKTPIYHIWTVMKDRCFNPKNKNYSNYGGRGIRVCDEWINDFMSFYNWANAYGYKKGLSIDRINNNLHYSPDNCRWATSKEQSRNTSRNVYIFYNGKTYLQSDLCREYNIPVSTFKYRLKSGLSVEDCLSKAFKGEVI